MSSEISNFGHLILSRRAGGETVRLVRSPDEVVLLAFDTQTQRLVELHLLNGGQVMEGAAKRSSQERALIASEVRGPSFMRILDVGEDQGVVYYTSNLNEGEFVHEYVERRGALPPATVFSLLLQLLDDVMLLGEKHRLVPQLRLDRVMLTTTEDTFLQLRLYDYGLSGVERPGSYNSRQVLQICELVFVLLTGKHYAGENPDRFPALTALPMSLRTTLRAALTDPGNIPVSLEKLRDDLREAYGSQVSSIQARNTRKHLVVTAATQPKSQLQDLLLEGVPVERILGSRFHVEADDSGRRHPFSIPCINAKTEHPVTVHLLPPSRIVDRALYEAVPLQSWRFNPEKHPNILRSLSLWESPEWSFLTEEREPGFPLSRLLTERLTLNPAEVVVVLRQVYAGLEQAIDCGVQRLDLHPSNLFLRVGKAGPMLAREHERLMQKRLDAWPSFQVKIRPHVTLRSLYEPPLIEPPPASAFESEHLADREHRGRSVVALALYLLTGQRQVGDTPSFPEAVPDALAYFIRETQETSRLRGQTLSPAEFIDKFEAVLTGPATPDLATRLRGSTIAIEEMESAGSISDFEGDEDSSLGFDEADPDVSPISRRLHAHEFDSRAASRRGGSRWPVLVAAAVVILGLAAWWFMPQMAQENIAAEIKSEPAVEKKLDVAVAKQPDAAKPADVPPPPVEEVKKEPAKPAPAIVKSEPPQPPPAAAPVVVKNDAPMPAKAPAEPAKPAADAAKPAQPPAPAVAATPDTATKPVEKAPAKPSPPALTPPPPVTVPGPVIIRKALMPTPEEIAKFKQGQAKPRQEPQPAQANPPAVPAPGETGQPRQLGSIPAVNMASPNPPETKP